MSLCCAFPLPYNHPLQLHKPTPTQRLELIARVQLAHYLNVGLSEITASITEYTTTDIAAACSVAGVNLVKGGKKTVRQGSSVGFGAADVFGLVGLFMVYAGVIYALC